MLEHAGFEQVEWVAETGFNSSAKTKGALFRAVRPLVQRKVTVKDQDIRKEIAPGSYCPLLPASHRLGISDRERTASSQPECST